MARNEIEAVGLAFVGAYNDRDLATMLALTHPEIIGNPSRALSGGNYHGHDGLREWWATMTRRQLWYEIVVSTVHQAERRLDDRRDPADPSESDGGVATSAADRPSRSDQRRTERRRVSAHKLAMFGDLCIDGESLAPWAAVLIIEDGLVTRQRSYLSSRSLLEEMGIVTEPIRRTRSTA